MKSRRLAATALAVAAAAVAVLPSAAAAQPRLHQVTINAAPNPALAGDAVVVFGRLFGPNHANKRVVLYHEVAPAQRFTAIQVGRTDSNGQYQFTRLPGVVDTNRRWFVQALPFGSVSRTVNERVEALVKLDPPATTNVTTGVPVTFTGTVFPNHVGGRILLQRQSATVGGDDWHTIDASRIGAGGAYMIVHRFVVPGDANVRVLLPRDERNIASPSAPVSMQISQKQNPNLTINSSVNPLQVGGATTISGTVQGAAAGTAVTLLAHTDRTGFSLIDSTTTDASGNYTFTGHSAESPTGNTFYRAVAGTKKSSVLFEGVKDVVTLTATPTSIHRGDTVAFTGTVTPDKSGHVIYLQRQGRDGDFHTVQKGTVGPGSQYVIAHRVLSIGTGVGTFRTLVPGGPENQSGASPTVQITIAPNVAPLSP